jgi:hypothetical protein
MADRCEDRTTRFLRRIDAHLATLRDHEARRNFLEHQIEGWQARYAAFIATEGQSEPVRYPSDPPQAADFLLTIVGLASRHCPRASITGERAMITAAKQGLDRTLLSVLVAADQRCPTIIGQAHLLYHARPASPSAETEKAVSRLKNEAESLLAAITQAELEIKTCLSGARDH